MKHLSLILIISSSILGSTFAQSWPKQDEEEGDSFDQNPRPESITVMDPDALKDPDALQDGSKDKENSSTGDKPIADQKKSNETDNVLPKIVQLYVPKFCPRKTQKGDLLVVHYTGWLLKSGRRFDTTVDVRRRYVPFEFVLGTGYVIRGWEKGLTGMCRGEKRKIIVPPELAYGKKGLRGIVPPNSVLVFHIDLLDVRRATPNYAPIDLFTALDKDGDKKLSRDEVSDYVKYQSRTYRHPNAPKPTDEEHEKMVDDIFHREDKDQDGHITHAEFSGPKLSHQEL